ncbi:MAG: zinc carboxypeptidase, partial [Bacteroidetes bacterium]
EWHLSHDKLVGYMQALAQASDRVVLQEYARTYEGRPLLVLLITSPENHRNLETIQAEHLALTDPERSPKLDLSTMPAVVYQGFSIHGNEPSGANAAPLVAYHLAAGQSDEVRRLLDEVVILLDPSFNPDGLQRFSTWANMHKSKNLVSDVQSREFDEVWPRGRTNHYWFDLNRDWLPSQHPESQGRLRIFHHWKPNILTDHHEMGSDRTFFFQPGIPSRTNPITPPENQTLTARIGTYHAAALDQIGSLYYSEESYDDFYYGKGSSYPDVNGGIGILFEQASSRGHLRDTDHGPMSFAFTIRNQVRTALSTLQAAREMRTDLLDYQRRFFLTAREAAAKHAVQAYVFSEPEDPARVVRFIELLQRHDIEVYHLGEPWQGPSGSYTPADAYIVPMQQPQFRLIRGIFERQTEFRDSLFYDVSTWTLPLAFDLQHDPVPKSAFRPEMLGEAITNPPALLPRSNLSPARYAYLIDWRDYHAPAVLHALLKEELRCKVATQAFTQDGASYPPGTLLLPLQNQPLDPASIHALLGSLAERYAVRVHAVGTGQSDRGVDLGSPTF